MYQFQRKQLARTNITLIILVCEAEGEAGEEIREEEVYCEVAVRVADQVKPVTAGRISVDSRCPLGPITVVVIRTPTNSVVVLIAVS